MSFSRRGLAILGFIMLSVVLLTTTSEAFHGNLFLGVEEEGADLAVTKSGPDTVAAASDVTFTVTVSNISSQEASEITLNDPIPAGLTFQSLDETNNPEFFICSTPAVGDSGVITCNASTLPAGAVSTFSIVLHVPADAQPGTTFTNLATVSSAGDPNSENNSGVASFTVPGAPMADLAVLKTAPANALPGSDISFVIMVTNAGPTAADVAKFTDILPSSTTFVSINQNDGPMFTCTTPAPADPQIVSCTLATMNAGASASFTLIAHVPDVPSGTQFSNTVSITSNTPDPNEENNSATATFTVSSADVGVTKTGPATANAGDNIIWKITLSNAGPSTTTAGFSDPLPGGTTFVSLVQDTGPSANCDKPPVGGAGVVTCSIPNLFPESSAQFTLTAKIGNTTSITNTATAFSESADPNGNNNSASVTTTVTPLTDLSVNKTDSPDPVFAGTNLTYTLTVGNAGPSDAQNVSLVDSVPANTTFVSAQQTSGPTFTCNTPLAGDTGNVSCSIVTFPVSGTATFQIVVQVGPNVPSNTVITNTATVSTSTGDTDGNNNMSSTTTGVSAQANLSLTKSDSPDPVLAGQDITYTLGLNNSGPSNAQTVTVTDGVPANTTFVSAEVTSGTGWTTTAPAVGGTGNVVFSKGTVTSGETAAFKIVVKVNLAATNGSQISNTAVASSTTADPDSNNNSATATTAVSVQADLSLTKGDTPDPVLAGQDITYTLGLNNNGPSSAQTVAVTDSVPANATFVSAEVTSGSGWTTTAPPAGGTGNVVFSKGTVASGETAAFKIVVKVNAAAPHGSQISNSAVASSSTADPDSTNNTATATTQVVSKPDLTISKTHTGNFSPGQMGATYTLHVSNVDTGPSSGQVTVTDVVPVGLTPTGPNSFVNGWSCSINGQTLTCTRSDVLAGGAGYPDIILTVNVANPAPLSVTNTATVAGGNDSNPGNNSASDVTNINCSVNSSLNNPNPLMISRFRENGPNGPADEFIEIYNPTTTAHTVSAGNCTGGYSVVSSTGNGNSSNAALQVCQIPNGTVIPAGGYYLCTGVTYSLNNLGLNGGAEGATATGDAQIGCGGHCIADVPDDAGLALIDVGSTGINLCQPGTIGCPTGFNFSSIAGNGNARVFDSVGFGPYGPGAPAPARPSLASIFCEGTCLQPVGDASTAANCANPSGLFPTVAVPPACYGQAGQYELLRRQTTFDAALGTVHHDTNNNTNDFIFVAPNSAINMGLHLTGVSGVSAVLGASLPQNSTAPADVPRPSFTQAPFDSGANQLGPRNAERDYALDPTVANTANDPLGTFTLRYRYTNNSGRPLFPIRFRVDNLSTLCGPQNATTPVGTGDARNLASPGDCGTGSFTALLKVLNSKKEIVVDSEATAREVFGTVMEDLSVGAPAAPGPLSPFGGGIDNTVIINGSTSDASVGDGVTGGTGIFNVVSFKDPPANVLRIRIKFGVVRSGRFILLLTPAAKPGPTPLPG